MKKLQIGRSVRRNFPVLLLWFLAPIVLVLALGVFDFTALIVLAIVLLIQVFALRHLFERSERKLRTEAKDKLKKVRALETQVSQEVSDLLAEMKALEARINRDMSEARAKAESASKLASKLKADMGVQREELAITLPNTYTVASAVSYLYSEILPSSPIWFKFGWAASAEFLAVLLKTIRQEKPQLIHEMGSGISTLVAAHGLEKNGFGKVIAYEHLPEYADQTQALIDAHGLGHRAKVVLTPLVETDVKGETYNWYEARPQSGVAVDLLVVDGPPASTGPKARYPALPVFQTHLSPSALVFLDDVSRNDELEILNAWTQEHDLKTQETTETVGGQNFVILKSMKG